MLIDTILDMCKGCGLENDSVKAGMELGVSVPKSNGSWTERTYFDGESGYAMCLTEKHVPERYYDRVGNEIIYMEAFASDKGESFMKSLVLFLPTITSRGTLRFVKSAPETDIYRKETIMDGIYDAFIGTDGSYESFVPEVQASECESAVIGLVKRYITNVAAVCRTLK